MTMRKSGGGAVSGVLAGSAAAVAFAFALGAAGVLHSRVPVR